MKILEKLKLSELGEALDNVKEGLTCVVNINNVNITVGPNGIEKEKKPKKEKKNPADFTLEEIVKIRIDGFKRKGENTDDFSVDDFLKKFTNPTCYLTGEPINLMDRKSYHLDHITPVVLGGTSNLDNCGILSAKVNVMKGGLSLDEFISLCKLIAKKNQ